MERVSRISPDTASEEVGAIYEEIRRVSKGWVPDLYQVLAHRPPLLEGFWKIQRSLILKGKIDPQRREMVNAFVSLKNRCEYCAHHHLAFGLRAGLTREKLDALESYAESPLFSDVEKLLLRYADEYLSQGGASPEVVEALKKHWSEEQVVELEVILGSINLANHFITSMDIEIEKERISSPELEQLRKRMSRSRGTP